MQLVSTITAAERRPESGCQTISTAS